MPKAGTRSPLLRDLEHECKVLRNKLLPQEFPLYFVSANHSLPRFDRSPHHPKRVLKGNTGPTLFLMCSIKPLPKYLFDEQNFRLFLHELSSEPQRMQLQAHPGEGGEPLPSPKVIGFLIKQLSGMSPLVEHSPLEEARFVRCESLGMQPKNSGLHKVITQFFEANFECASLYFEVQIPSLRCF